jgi:hypothetical protein
MVIEEIEKVIGFSLEIMGYKELTDNFILDQEEVQIKVIGVIILEVDMVELSVYEELLLK